MVTSSSGPRWPTIVLGFGMLPASTWPHSPISVSARNSRRAQSDSQSVTATA